MLLNIFQTGPLDVNTYVLKDEESKEAVLIDVGGEFEEIQAKLKLSDSIVKTEDKIKEIEDKRNQLVGGNNPHQLGLKPRK
jgi:hypothetical protein